MKRLALVTAGAAAFACLMPAAPTMAAGNATADLSTPTVSVKSTGGQTLKMSIGASHDSSGTTMTMRLEHKSSKSDETHTWSFPLASTGLTYSSPKGKLVTGTKLGAYGTVSVTFSKVSSTTKSCGSVQGGKTTVTTTVVKFKGRVNFAARNDTKASSWGSVKKGSKSSPYTFGKKKGVYITTTNGPCDVKIVNSAKCYELWSWESNEQSANALIDLGGDHRVQGSTTLSEITASSASLLSSPKKASRIDLTTVNAPAPQFNGSANPNTLHASTSAGTAASGGGTMTASSNGQTNAAGKCTKPDGSTAHESGTFWPATWTNDAQKLTVHQAIGGSISLPNGSQGVFQHYTFS